MSLLPNKFLLNILACGLILSCPLLTEAKTNETTEKPQAIATQFKWKNYTFSESGFSIDFPTKPEHVEQSIDIPNANLKINYETYLSEPSDDVVLVTSVWNYPNEIDMSKPDVNLKDGFNGMVSALPGSEVLETKMTEVDGFKSLEFLVKNENIYFQGKLILVYNTLYQVFTVYKNSVDMKDNYIHFVDSFHLINPEQHKATPPSPTNGKGSGSTNKVNI